MSEVAVVGAGLGGLFAAMLLADDGHHVVVLERDAGVPPEAVMAWDEWDRRGVAQFRQLYYLLPRFRLVAERELAAFTGELATVALRHDPLAGMPGRVGRDHDIVTLTARRPIVEAAAAGVAAAHPAIDVRRGVAVHGLVAGASDSGDHRTSPVSSRRQATSPPTSSSTRADAGRRCRAG